MTLTISAEQRDALHDLILDRMSGIEDVWLAVCAKNFDAAKHLGMEFSDSLRLVSEDLGWGEGTGESVELTTPPDVLRRVFNRLRHSAVSQSVGHEEERVSAEAMENRSRLVVEASQHVLAQLEDTG